MKLCSSDNHCTTASCIIFISSFSQCVSLRSIGYAMIALLSEFLIFCWLILTQPANQPTYKKLTIEILKHGVNMFKVNNKDTMNTPMASNSVSIVNFEHGNAAWEEPLGEWNNSKIWETRKILTILYELNTR